MIRKLRPFLALMLFTSIPSFAATISVSIKDFQFVPNTVIINLGDSVKWTNQGEFPHTTTQDNTPKPLWDSKTLAPNASYPRQFNTEGTFISTRA